MPNFGEPYKAQTHTLFNATGAQIASIIDVKRKTGMVGVDFWGKWNHGAKDVVNMVMHQDTAREIAEALLEAVQAAKDDEGRYRREAKP